MDDTTKIARLRAVIESDEADEVLLTYLRQARALILNRMYPYLDDADGDFDDIPMPKKYDWKQVQIAAFWMNKRGAEGETQHIENGTHRYYRNADVPPELLQDIMPLIGIPG